MLKLLRRVSLFTIAACVLVCAGILASRAFLFSEAPLCAHCNVIVIAPGSLGASRTSLGGTTDTTPFLASLAKERGIVFTHAYAQAPWSIPSYASLLTGRYPWDLNIWGGVDPLPENAGSIADTFTSAGYATGLFSNGLIRPEFGFNQGFGVVDGALTLQSLASGGALFASAGAWMNQQHASTTPFFLFLNPYDLHDRFGFSSAAMQQSATALKTTYDADVRATDSDIERFFDALDASGLASTTIVVITSGNGEEFGEHGGVGQHSSSLYDESIGVPLIVVVPGQAPKVIDASVELRSVAATLLELTGLSPRSVQGASLVPFMRGTETANRTVLSQTAQTPQSVLASVDTADTLIRTLAQHGRDALSVPTAPRAVTSLASFGRFVVIRSSDGTSAIYDRDTDPGETHDLSPSLTSLPADAVSIITSLRLMTNN